MQAISDIMALVSRDLIGPDSYYYVNYDNYYVTRSGKIVREYPAEVNLWLYSCLDVDQLQQDLK